MSQTDQLAVADFKSAITYFTKQLTIDHKSRVAIIGTEGVGKTVFISTLAKHIESSQSDGWFLDPQNAITQRYVDRVWSVLANGDWPAATDPGTLQQLFWKLHMPQLGSAELRLIDPPGHDIRRLFSDNRAELESIPDDLHDLAHYCREAEIVIFLINLGDFLGEPNQEMRRATELALKFGLEYVKQTGPQSKHCCLVFTQIDQYPGLIAEEGNWSGVARRYLPTLFGSQLRNGDVFILGVSAVNATQVVVDEQGQARKTPAPNFQSNGFDELLKWINDCQRQIKERAERRSILAAVNMAAMVAAALFGLWLIAIGLVIPTYRWWVAPPPPPKTPIPIVLYKSAKVKGVFWEDVEISTSIRNIGVAGHITVFGYVEQQGKIIGERRTTEYFNAGETRQFSFTITEYNSGIWNYDVSAK